MVMASRTKSFFEPDSRLKVDDLLLLPNRLAANARSMQPTPPQWKGQHSNKNQGRPILSEIDGNIPSAKPPILPTAQTKSKLKAFAFIEGRPAEHENSTAQDENVSDRSPTGIEQEACSPRAITSSAPTPIEQAPVSTSPVTFKEPQLPHANTFPSTPGMRLPLADLIGNLDDRAIIPESNTYSPEDQLTWIPHSSSEFLTPNRRKRKRARSSSPSCPDTSSQRQATSARFLGVSAINAESETPDTDPAADLWQRYAGGKTYADGLKLPDFHSLKFEVSPRPLQTPMKSGGLRRWASTGNDWPRASSKNKRHRREPKTDIRLWRDQQQNQSSGKSKVAFMVEKIQESLASQNLTRSAVESEPREPAPSSSSPVPRMEAPAEEKSSPTHSRLHTSGLEKITEMADQASVPPVLPRNSSKTSLSEAELSSTHQERQFHDPFVFAPLKLQSKAPLPAFKRPSMNRTSSGGGRVYPTAQIDLPIPEVFEVDKELDEFGDDFELSAEDLEELVAHPPALQRSLDDVPPHPADPLPEPMSASEYGSFSTEAVAKNVQIQNEFGLSDDENEDEFGCDDIDEDSFAQAEIPPRQRAAESTSPYKPTFSNHSSFSKNAHDTFGLLQRFKVNQVIDGKYTNTKGQTCQERLLMTEEERTSRPTAIALRGSWIQTTVAPSNIVHIAHIRTLGQCSLASPSPPGQMIVSDDKNSPLLVVHPDHMLSATTVADSFDCLRKAVLQDRIKATSDTSKAMVYGKILHEIFQQALAANQWDDNFLSELIQHTMQSHVEGLWELGMKDTVLAMEEIRAKMAELAAWAAIFVAPEPGTKAVVEDRRGEKILMSVSKLIAIEEHIWSPQFGLKGNIDATIESTLIDDASLPSKRFIAPFEVKTGRTTQSAAHMAQTALYTLLLSDRYDVTVEAGILYYLESSSMARVAPPVSEMRQMIQQRNRLASHIYRARIVPDLDHDPGREINLSGTTSQDIEESGLPGLLRNPFKCGKCYARQSCFAYHALVENGTADSAGLIDDSKKNHSLVWHDTVGHLGLKHHTSPQVDALRKWFTKWDKLLTLEESDQNRHRKELWTMSSAEREAKGRCFGNLMLKTNSETATDTSPSTLPDGIQGGGGKINRFTFVFSRSAGNAGGSFAEGSQLTAGEPVVVSSENGQWALANGYVIATSKHDITVAVDRKLGGARQRLESFDEARNQVFRGSMTTTDEQTRPSVAGDSILYRLDKDEFSNGLALIRNNLVTLMSPHPIHVKLRGQIIDGHAPAFAPALSSDLPQTQLGEMNKDQREAVDKVLSAQDYALILGMPGTGKTTTIAHIINALLAEHKTILLTSFTHTAVDNILLKIRDLAPPNSILRLGVPAKIDPEVQTFCQLATTPLATIDDIEQVYMGCQIVATTCMGTNHAIFRRRAFDICIVDEASQITLPTSLGPLLHARKFVLVGDHYQLPPLVQNRAALEGGFDVSLFRQLSEEHPEAVAMLGEQYRMCEDIMTLSNELIYNGKLRCGNETVAGRTLRLTNESGLLPYHTDGTGAGEQCSIAKLERRACWLSDLSDPSRKVVFANTDSCGASGLETLTSGNRITNVLEATISAQIVISLLALGVPGREIGVITFYRSQLHLMRQIFGNAGISSDVEIDSADRFQGRDKECIVLSMVRSNEIGTVGELLKDWRRINVALTRAKSKLIVLGSRRTLSNNELLKKFLELVDRRGWGIDLPQGADEAHAFNFSSQTNVTASASTPGRSRKSRELRSPLKNRSPLRPTRAGPVKEQRAVLTSSPNAANRGNKIPGKVVKGSKPTGSAQKRTKQMKEQIVMEIWEDLAGDEF
nr:dna replication atp-dependent helicase/nuclease dna2 [Quercus suber]